MRRLASALIGAWLAALAAGPAMADTASNSLSVSVTVVAPGTLGSASRPSGTVGTAVSDAPASDPPSTPAPANPAK